MSEQVQFRFKDKKDDGSYRVYVGDMFIGSAYPEWGPWLPNFGGGWGHLKREQTGWIASAHHFRPGGYDQNIHVHAKKREDAVEELWEQRKKYGWNDCPVGKRSYAPGERKPTHTCKRLPNATISVTIEP